jgi:hypothetical protein
MRHFGVAMTLLAVCGCNCGGSSSGTTGGTSAATEGSTATGGRTSSGGSAGSTTEGGSGGGTSAGANSTGGGASTGASSGGSTGSLPSCGVNAVWINDVCTRLGCSQAPIDAPCVLADGGAGFCAGGGCQSVNMSSDPNNCGGFGLQCPPGEACVGAECAGGCEKSGSLPCPAGTACLGGYACAPTACAAGMTDQTCIPSDFEGQGVCCGTSCIGDSDTSNCGACGLSCGDAGFCDTELGGCIAALPCDVAQANAPCVLQSSAQYPGLCCHGVCEDPALDTSDCQACGQSCTQCTFGSVGGCPAGQGCTVDSLCAPASCAGLEDGLACSTQPSVINPAGFVSATSWQGQEQILTECCSGACVDLDFDSSNCGGCGIACSGGTACQWGVCRQSIDCAAGANGSPCWLADAGGEGVCCTGACVDTSSDPLNCQLCGEACPSGFFCAANGSCVSDGGVVVDPLPTVCGPGSEGETCAGGVCCGGGCLVPGTLAACAACGLDCPSCSAGCPAGTTCAGQGYEALPDGGLAPLDACLPVACAPGVSGGECAFGPDVAGPYTFPGPGAISAERSFQDGNPGFCCNGSCVDIGQDPNNCGLCGVVCPSGVCTLAFGGEATCLPPGPSNDCLQTCAEGDVCVGGFCLNSYCNQSWSQISTYCAAASGNVGVCCPRSGGGIPCADLANDPANCGGCGFICPVGQSCAQGVCSATPANCGIGRIGGFCDLDAGDGFVCCPGTGCTNLAMDAANCGNCGSSCISGLSCISGICE